MPTSENEVGLVIRTLASGGSHKLLNINIKLEKTSLPNRVEDPRLWSQPAGTQVPATHCTATAHTTGQLLAQQM